MARNTKLKQLTVVEITKLDTALNTQKAIRILDDKYEVTIDTHFRESKLITLATKYLTFLQQLNGIENVTEKTIVGAINLLPALVIQEFSNVPVPEVSSIEELIQTQNALLDTGILKEVWDSFDPKEIEKVTEKMKQISQNAGQVIGELAVQQSLQGVESDGNIQ